MHQKLPPYANAAVPSSPPEPQWATSDPRWEALESCRARYTQLLAERPPGTAPALDAGKDSSLVHVHRDLEALVGERRALAFERAWRVRVR